MNRRSFIKKGTASASILGFGICGLNAMNAFDEKKINKLDTFKLNYAPHLGMFRHHAGDNPVDQLNFMADQGFRAFEDNNMKNRPIEIKKKWYIPC